MSIDPVDLLEQMLRLPSVSGHEADVARFLVATMRELGFEAHVDAAGNAVGAFGTGPEVVLLGHIDTVPGEIPVRRTNGKLYGRGAVDAKGPFATFVCAAARLLKQGHGGLRYVLIGATEEEAASSKGAHHACATYRPVACVIGEPSGWNRVTLGYKGRLLLDGRWQQASAHSASQVVAAPEQAAAFWHAVKTYCEEFNQNKPALFDQLLPSLRAIASGSDGLHDWATLTIGIRLPPSLDPDALTLALQALASPSAELQFRSECRAFRAERNNGLVRAFTTSIRAHQGNPGFVLKTGTSDMNLVGPVWQCPIVAYGPGDSNLDHTPDEHVEIAELGRAIDVLENVLQTLSL